MNRYLISILSLLLAVVTLTGCAGKPVAPIPYVAYQNPEQAQESKKLLIMLRGIGGDHLIFEEHGLVEGVFDKDYPFDVIAPEAHFGYYRAETLGERLHEDIIVPARENGYEEIWIAGTSMGGLGALMYLTDYPGTIDGVILLSPFLGLSGILSEIEDAGGLDVWEPGPVSDEDWQRSLWAWLQKYDRNLVEQTEIYLGYGDRDLFTRGQKILATALPEDHTTVVDGGHTYDTLRRLWSHYMGNLDEQFTR